MVIREGGERFINVTFYDNPAFKSSSSNTGYLRFFLGEMLRQMAESADCVQRQIHEPDAAQVE